MKLPFPLAALSNELLYMILSYVVQSDLVNLCRIRLFHNVAQELLYYEFHGKSRNIVSFLRTILSNERLANRVRCVYLGELFFPLSPALSLDSINLVNRYIVHLGMAQRIKEHWNRQISHGEILAAILLARLPTVERLDIQTWDQDLDTRHGLRDCLARRKPFWTLMMPQLTELPFHAPFLQNVRILSLYAPNCSVFDIAAVFTLPTLRSLHISGIIETPGLSQWAFLPRSNNISTLALAEATLSLQTLSQILLSCVALEHFAYNSPTDSQITRDFDSLINALSPFHNTLRTLDFLEQDPWSKKISPIHSLAQFSKLERFSSDTCVLIGKDMVGPALGIFPESLREILLVDPFSSMLDSLGGTDRMLEVFAEAKSTCLPRLVKVDLVPAEDDELYSDKDLKFSKNGVELCIRAESLV